MMQVPSTKLYHFWLLLKIVYTYFEQKNSLALDLIECLKSNLMCEQKLKKFSNHRVVNVKLGLATIYPIG
jgi:hypothetical protein